MASLHRFATFLVGCFVSFTSSFLMVAASSSATPNPMLHPQDAASYHILHLVNWLNSFESGYFNYKLQIRRADPSDPTSYFGVFAGEDLEQDEMLMYIPAEARIHSIHKKGDYTDILCELAWALRDEFDQGYNGPYIHYVNYLKEQRGAIIPAVWSQAGKDLLMKVQDELYMKDYYPRTAHGTHLINWIEEWFEESCLMNKSGKESLHPYFLAVVTQRGFDNMLAPVYDFFNHHNGNVNIYNKKSIYHREGFDVYASRPIKAGEELFFSYHNCPDCRECVDCDSSQTYWGTPEMLRDFGFVEPYPHTFYLGDYMTFVVSNATTDGTQEPTINDLSIKYLYDTYPSMDVIAEAKRELDRLEKVYQDDILKADTKKVAPHELYTIMQYYKALSNAFKVMIITFDPEVAAELDKKLQEEEEEEEKEEEDEEEESADWGNEEEEGEDWAAEWINEEEKHSDDYEKR